MEVRILKFEEAINTSGGGKLVMDTAEVLKDTLYGEETKMEEVLLEIKKRCDKRSKKHHKGRMNKGNAKS